MIEITSFWPSFTDTFNFVEDIRLHYHIMAVVADIGEKFLTFRIISFRRLSRYDSRIVG